MLSNFRKKYIGDKNFFQMLGVIMMPLVISNLFSQSVNLIDNVMVGRIGTVAMSSVLISNQIFLVFNLAIFGVVGGAGIFSAQYFGKGDLDGVRKCFRYRILLGILMAAFFFFIIANWDEELIRLFMTDDNTIDLDAVSKEARAYLWIVAASVPAFLVSQGYTAVLRETSETVIPMRSSGLSVISNIIFNYILIFGKLGLPAMGVKGAALATVIARYIEAAFLVIVVHTNKKRFTFAEGLFRPFELPGELIKKITIKALPLLANEILWSMSMTSMLQCFSTRGMTVVGALNIANTMRNVFQIMVFAIGSSIGIIIGQKLGAGEIEEAKDLDRKLFFCCIVSCVLIGGLEVILAGAIPQMYNTENAVRSLATAMIIIDACFLPVNGFLHSSYSTIRAGGSILLTFLCDSGYLSTVTLGTCFIIAYATEIPIIPFYAISRLVELGRMIFAAILLKKGSWAKNIVTEKKEVI